MNQEEMLIKLQDITRRRLVAYENSKSNDYKDWMSSVAYTTTVEDIILINEASEMLDEFAQTVVDLVLNLSSEYVKGIRCSVCSRTTRQSEDIGYDCVYEC